MIVNDQRLSQLSAAQIRQLPTAPQPDQLRCDRRKSVTVLFLLLTAVAHAQYAIDWFTVDGGGGNSTNAQYALSGTIGQPDAGMMSGGNYTLQGGFWGIVAALQTPGAPWLIVLRTATNTVAVSWPNTDPGWKLHWTANLAGTISWNEIAPPYPVSGTNCVVLDSGPTGNKFYRLHKP